MCYNAFPVRGTLFKQGGHIDPQCPLCLADIESTEYLFRWCTTTHLVWELAIEHKWIPCQVQFNRTQNWVQSFGTLKDMCNDKTLQRIAFL